MSDLFNEVTGQPLPVEEAGTLGPGSSRGVNRPAGGDQSDGAIAVVKREVLALGVNESFAVATADEATSAADVLGKIKGMHRRLEEERKARVGPLNDLIRAVNGEYTGPRDLLIGIEEKIKLELLVFRNAEQRHIDEQRKLQLQVAEQERARLEEAARHEREAAAAKAEKLRGQGKEEKADALQRQAEASAQAKERTAALVAAPGPGQQAPTKLAGTSFRTAWKAKVINMREFIGGVLASPYPPETLLEVKQQALDRLAASLQANMDKALPGTIAWPDDSVAARAK